MRLQTHMELGNIVDLKGVNMAVASYHPLPAMNTTLVELEIIDEDDRDGTIICQDKNNVYHQVPKSSVYNPLYDL